MTPGRPLACLVIFLLIHPAALYGASLVVPDQFPTIQSAINAASNGDTVLVRPGRYVESLAWANKDLVLLGGGPADAVVVTTNLTARVLLLGPGITRQSVIKNIALRRGSAQEGGGVKLIGLSRVPKLPS